ncbi:UNVERIFIED_CONTAM: hypothetical protein HHA_252300 [Hammondia hammondi]|eukprot:XP_008888583.1 hypothetical protein HHA_252300 [Hammondia hammondi]
MPFSHGITPRRGGAATIVRPLFAILFLVYLLESVCAHEGPPASRRADADGRERGPLHIVDSVFAENSSETESEGEVVDPGLTDADIQAVQKQQKEEASDGSSNTSTAGKTVNPAVETYNSITEQAKPNAGSTETAPHRSFYGRMLQAVSDFFFFDADVVDSDSEGFLSPRKKPPAPSPVPDSNPKTAATEASSVSDFPSAPNADPVGGIDDSGPSAASSTNLLRAYQGVSEGDSSASLNAYTDLLEGEFFIPEPLSAEVPRLSPRNAASMLGQSEIDLLARKGRPRTKVGRSKWDRGAKENLRSRAPYGAAQKNAQDVSQLSDYQKEASGIAQQLVSPAPVAQHQSGAETTQADSGGAVLRSNTNAATWEDKVKGVMSLVDQASKLFGSRTELSQNVPEPRQMLPDVTNVSGSSTASPVFSQGLASLLTGGMPQIPSGSTTGPSIPSQSIPLSPAEVAAYVALLPSQTYKPSVTLGTLRQSEGLGKTFAQGVDVGSAVVDVLTSTRELQQALSALNIPGLPVNPGAPLRQASQNRDDSLTSLVNAAKAVQQFAHWSATVDKAINTSKDFTRSVPTTLRSLFPSNRRGNEETDNAVKDEDNREDSKTTREHEMSNEDITKGQLDESIHAVVESQEDELTTSSHTTVAAAVPVPERDPRTEEEVRYRRIRLADVEESGAEHYIDGRPRILSASASANGTESPVPKEPLARATGPLRQGNAGAGGALRLFTKSAALMDEMAHALKREESLPEVSDASAAGGEYVVGLARDLHKMASFLFNVLDVTVSVADESMNALQLGNLVDTYKSLAEEGALAPIGVKASGAPPEHMGKPTVSCVSKGMTCCVPAAAAADWKTKPLYLQNEQRRECKANFVTRTSMLCATTPYKNSKCGIIHTKANSYNKYATVLPVAGFTATAMCECEVSKQKSVDGLFSFNGTASWTAPGKQVTRDVVQEAKNGWQFVKILSKSGNQMLGVLENTLSPQRSPIAGMADVMTKLVVNQQLQKIAEAADPLSAVFPSISVALSPKKPLLRSPPSLPPRPVLPLLQTLTRPLLR